MQQPDKSIIAKIYSNTSFHHVVENNVKSLVNEMPEPEYRMALMKTGNFEYLAHKLGIFVSGGLINYAINNRVDIEGLDWTSLNLSLNDIFSIGNDGKSIINAVEDIIDFIETVDKIDDFFDKLQGNNADGSLVMELFENTIDFFEA